MSVKSVFRKMAGKPAASFDEANRMTTRVLPIPGRDNMGVYLRFTAQKSGNDRWTIYIDSNDIWYAKYYPGYKLSEAAVNAAIAKHADSATAKDNKVSFDAAFMILREVEEAHLKYSNKLPSPGEPSDHYMVAYRLLPQQFQEGLEDIYKSRLEKSNIMPPRPPQPAPKQPGKPKPD